MKLNIKDPKSSTNTVRFEFVHPTTKTVYIAGSFNQWSPHATPMISNGRGRWTKELSLPPGIYEYRLIVDGHWMIDPLAKGRKPNPFGGFNSVMIVPLPAQPSNGQVSPPRKPEQKETAKPATSFFSSGVHIQ